MAFVYILGSIFWRRRCGFLPPRDVLMGNFVSSSPQQSPGSKVWACTHFRNWHFWCRGISPLGPVWCLVFDISHHNSFHPRSLHCKYYYVPYEIQKVPITTAILQEIISGPVFKNRRIRCRQTLASSITKKERDSESEISKYQISWKSVQQESRF